MKETKSSNKKPATFASCSLNIHLLNGCVRFSAYRTACAETKTTTTKSIFTKQEILVLEQITRIPKGQRIFCTVLLEARGTVKSVAH